MIDLDNIRQTQPNKQIVDQLCSEIEALRKQLKEHRFHHNCCTGCGAEIREIEFPYSDCVDFECVCKPDCQMQELLGDGQSRRW